MQHEDEIAGSVGDDHPCDLDSTKRVVSVRENEQALPSPRAVHVSLEGKCPGTREMKPEKIRKDSLFSSTGYSQRNEEGIRKGEA